MVEREQLTDEKVMKGLEVLTHQIGVALQNKGYDAFSSNHETFGRISEDYVQLGMAAQQDDLMAFADKLMAVASLCVLGLASMLTSTPPSTNDAEAATTEVESTEMPTPLASEFIDDDKVEELARNAREAMKERMAASNLVLPD